MQILHSDRVIALVGRLKDEHLTQSDPNVQARVLVLVSEYFDLPSIVEDTGQVPMSRRALGLVPDGVVTGPAHAPVLAGNATAPRFVEPPPVVAGPRSLLTEQEELAGKPLTGEGSGTGRYGDHDNWTFVPLAQEPNDSAVESEPVATDPTPLNTNMAIASDVPVSSELPEPSAADLDAVAAEQAATAATETHVQE